MKHIVFSVAFTALCLPVHAEAPQPHGDAGAYLAARQAAADNRFAEAATFFDRAIAADPDEPELSQAAAFLHAVGGNLDTAAAEAEKLEAEDLSSPHSTLILMVRDAKAGDWQRLLEGLESGRQTSPVMDSFARAWGLMGRGDMSAALDAFDDAMKEEGLSGYARQHKALALALAGDMEGAEGLLSSPESEIGLSEVAILARVEVLSQLDRNDEAFQLITDAFGSPPVHAGAAALLTRLEAGETLPFTRIASPAEGLGVALLLVANAHGANETYAQALLHARLSAQLWPNSPSPELAAAEALIALDRPDLAAEALDRIPEDSPARFQADMSRARALDAAGHTGEAIAVLETLSFVHPDQPEIWSVLADMRRREGRMEEARTAYSRALALTEPGAPAAWVLHYARGIVHNELGDWPAAQADFEAALEDQPEQPSVLNYLGYSMVEREEDLPRALELIERAVELAPNNGAIVDSLAWALFRLGRVEDAVPHMERAAELEPTDPVITDHLGDVLWAAGRRDEAMFEWRRALSFDPTPEDAERIRSKLQEGPKPPAAPE